MQAVGNRMQAASQPMQAIGKDMQAAGMQIEHAAHTADSKTRQLIEHAFARGAGTAGGLSMCMHAPLP